MSAKQKITKSIRVIRMEPKEIEQFKKEIKKLLSKEWILDGAPELEGAGYVQKFYKYVKSV